jgi:hypothetical protein
MVRQPAAERESHRALFLREAIGEDRLFYRCETAAIDTLQHTEEDHHAQAV